MIGTVSEGMRPMSGGSGGSRCCTGMIVGCGVALLCVGVQWESRYVCVWLRTQLLVM